MSDSVELPSGKGAKDENFPVGSRLISKRLRPHIQAFYAFARNADDIADHPGLGPEDKLARLDWMGAVLTGQTQGGAPSAAALRESLNETGVTPRHSLDLLLAFKQDATKTRYASWDELFGYCCYSAMPVGRHVLSLHGEGVQTLRSSDALCAALQVLNHLQDCADDLQSLNRCYLPQDMLAANDVSFEHLLAPRASPGVRAVVNELLYEVDQLNRTARELPSVVSDRRLRVETAVIAGLSRQLARRLWRQDPLARRVKLLRGDVMGSILLALPYLR